MSNNILSFDSLRKLKTSDHCDLIHSCKVRLHLKCHFLMNSRSLLLLNANCTKHYFVPLKDKKRKYKIYYFLLIFYFKQICYIVFNFELYFTCFLLEIKRYSCASFGDVYQRVGRFIKAASVLFVKGMRAFSIRLMHCHWTMLEFTFYEE